MFRPWLSQLFARKNMNKEFAEHKSFGDYIKSSKFTNFQERKDHILKLPLSEKRKLYKCGKQFVTLDKLDTWSKFKSDPNLNLDGTADLLQHSEYKFVKEYNDKIFIFNGNIACLEVDAIVNAANKSLLGGGGVDAVIHTAAGNSLCEECKTLNGCDTGCAKITGGYNLPAKYVIHTVGPIGEQPSQLQNCYRKSLELAVANGIKTIAFPCVSTGVYGYPNEKAAQVVLGTVRTYLEANCKDIEGIIFCLFMDVDKKMYSRYLPYYFPKHA